MTAAASAWTPVGTSPQELLLANTLVTGQSFRWCRTGSDPYDTYTGVIGQRLVQMRQLPGDVEYRVLARGPSEDPAADAAVLHDYLNLGTSLTQLSQHWASKDTRYALVAPALPGCRMLRQDPVECLFQFICSSNNHISRIHGMVERLCSRYGTSLLPSNSGSSSGTPGSAGQLSVAQQQEERQGSIQHYISSPGTPAVELPSAGQPSNVNQQQQQQQLDMQAQAAPLPFLQDQTNQKQAVLLDAPQIAGQQLQQPLQQPPQQPSEQQSFFAFPTLEQLSAATEEALRADGFGYRAKFIVSSVQQLLAQPEGGKEWLLGLREKPYAEAHEALCSLPGVGPKVAACICLFSLDKHDAIPVDTHVWDLATRYYAPHLAKKSLTPKLHAEVQQAFIDRFGPYAGWAHNCLFISELASHKHLLQPASAATRTTQATAAKKRKAQQQGREQPPNAQLPAAADAAASATAAAAAASAEGDAAASVSEAMEAAAQPETLPPRRRRRRPAKLQGAGIDAPVTPASTPGGVAGATVGTSV